VPALMEARLLVFAAILLLAPLAIHGGEGTRFAEPGMIAPDFTVLDVEGHPFRLREEVSRKPVLLLFWSVFCVRAAPKWRPSRGRMTSTRAVT
jgi:hypothetical protein